MAKKQLEPNEKTNLVLKIGSKVPFSGRDNRFRETLCESLNERFFFFKFFFKSDPID